MKVFISWSGATSRKVALALSAWLPKVIQGIEPFVSAKDIDKGANWTVELAKELEDAEFGIICLAPDNLLSPWLNYEAGAITKSVNSRVCPVLFEVEKNQVNPPIAQLQMTSIDVDEFLMLMTSMNKVAGSPLSAEALKEALQVWWPLLETDIRMIQKPDGPKLSVAEVAPEPDKPRPDLTEMIAEVLHRVRNVDQRISRIERNDRPRPAAIQHDQDFDRVESNITSKLMSIASNEGLPCNTGRNGPSSIDLDIDGDIPATLPLPLFSAALEVARDRNVRVRVIGDNRTAIFEKDGTTIEDPF